MASAEAAPAMEEITVIGQGQQFNINPMLTQGFNQNIAMMTNGDQNFAYGIGGDGAPDKRFMRDGSGNLVYSDEVNGPYSDCKCLVQTSAYHASRDNGTTFHGGIDVEPILDDEVVVTAKALSVTLGKVYQIGANGFGKYSVTVKTPKGNFATYGHLNSVSVSKDDTVKPGDVLGVIGYQGNVHPKGVLGTHLHFQITTGAPFGEDSKFLGVPSP